MKNLKQKLIYFLSDPTISEKELDQLIVYLKTDKLEEITSSVKKIRNTLRKIEKSSNELSSNISLDDDDYSSDEQNSLLEVIRLLLVEAHLTIEEAMDLLTYRYKHSLIPNQGLSFVDWIKTLGEKVGWSELLHMAHLIRNERVHGKSDNPWPLKQNDKNTKTNTRIT